MFPIRPPISVELLNGTFKSSIYTLKRNGDKVPHCFTPIETLTYRE